MNDIVVPYLQIDGVITAALVSAEGLPVAAAGSTEVSVEVLAAYAGAAMSAAVELAGELEMQTPRILTLDFSGRALILAPVTNEIFLLLIREGGS